MNYYNGFGTASIVEEGDQGYQYPSFDTIPPVPAASGSSSDWSSPPMVTIDGQPIGGSAGAPSSGGGFIDSLVSLTGGLANIFGLKAQNQYAPKTPPPTTGTPGWVIPVVIGVGVVGLLVVMKTMKRPAVAGYRRRKSRRSRR